MLPLPSQVPFLHGRQRNECLDGHELLVFLNCFLKDCCCDSSKEKPPPLGHTFAVNMLHGILQTCSAEGKITPILSCS